MSSFRLGIRACVAIIPLLSVTWLFGLLTPLHKVFRYVFCPMIDLIDLKSLSFFSKGFLIFALHCAPNSQVSFLWKKKNSCRVRIWKSCMNIWVPFLFTLLLYRQIRERFKRKVRTVFPSATDGNSKKKNSNVNLGNFVMWTQLNWSFVTSLNWKKKTHTLSLKTDWGWELIFLSSASYLYLLRGV